MSTAEHDRYRKENSCLLVMEDLQGRTLEDASTLSGFEEAARTLARVRREVVEEIGKITKEAYGHYLITANQYIENITYISQKTEYMNAGQDRKLAQSINLLLPHIDRLYKNYPITLTHNDYHSKNLIINSQGCYVVDWASAYLSPHLGDLYCLTRSAEDQNIDRSKVLLAYNEECDQLTKDELEWQVCIGGICWIINTLRNLIDFELEYIPVAVQWIPDLINDLDGLITQIVYS